MTSAVEATSLSQVTSAAANPPLHPSATADSSSPRLTLYIARVPGSRDVFLTPMKPRDKIVTAQDVQSSLYYVHFNSEHDYEDSREMPRLTSASANASELPCTSPRPTRQRLNLPQRLGSPSSPPYPVYDMMPSRTARPANPWKPGTITRKPVLSDITNSCSSSAGVDLPTIPRRSLPTPPDEEPDTRSLHAENLRMLKHEEHTGHFNPYNCDYAIHPETLKQQELDARPASGSLTLIRRDPGSCEQWNVGYIHDPPVKEVSSSSLQVPSPSRRAKRGGAPLYLDITNPGYAPFRNESDRSESRASSSTTSSSTTSTDIPPEAVLRRRLFIPGSRYGDHGYGAGHRHPLPFQTIPSELFIPTTLRTRPSSFDSSRSSSSSLEMPRADRRAKGYTFISPWGGHCDFSTGATGKSLKCKHHLSLPAPNHEMSIEVSELRFNLPTATSSSPRAAKQTPMWEKRGSYFSAGHRRLLSNEDGDSEPTTPSVVIDQDTGRIDLSLGQEKAGGGFGGKQAKLGKLIIEPAGIEMLDLLVAANVGLWWRAYERA